MTDEERERLALQRELIQWHSGHIEGLAEAATAVTMTQSIKEAEILLKTLWHDAVKEMMSLGNEEEARDGSQRNNG